MADMRRKSLVWGTAAAAIGSALVLASLDNTLPRLFGSAARLVSKQAPMGMPARATPAAALTPEPTAH